MADRLCTRLKQRTESDLASLKYDYRCGPYVPGARRRSPFPKSKDPDPEKTKKLWEAKMRKLKQNVSIMMTELEKASARQLRPRLPTMLLSTKARMEKIAKAMTSDASLMIYTLTDSLRRKE